MKLEFVPCQKSEVVSRYANVFETLEDFINSGHDCVKLVGYPHKNARCCYHSFQEAIKRYRMKTVKVSVRKDNVYLIRVDV